jgi:transcription elongation factor GreA
MNKYQMSAEGLEKIKGEYEELKSRRADLIEKIKLAKEHGDLKENAEYHDAKDEMAMNEGRILELEDMIRNANLIHHVKTDSVTLGSKIKIQSKFGEKIFTIVGVAEANPSEGKISHESPLGSAFLGRSEGETFKVETPAGESEYTVLEIIE